VGKPVNNFASGENPQINAASDQREVTFPAVPTPRSSTDRGDLSTGTARLIGVLIALVWLGLSILWLRADHGLLDGDEQGHVGAAALFAEDLRSEAPWRWAGRLWLGDTGEYPGLYPAITGGAWAVAGEGQPTRPSIRIFNLGWLLLGAVAVGRVASRDEVRPRLAGLAASAILLLLPEANGLVRHFMPEGALVGWTGLTLLAAARARERPGVVRALALGAALGLGMLLKQTFAIYALAASLWALPRLRGRALWALALGLVLAAPWYTAHLAAQWAYGLGSAPSEHPASLAQHLAYYPLALAWISLGPVLLAGLLVWGRPRQAPLAALSLLVGLALLVAIPKKYPRLLAPLGPPVAVLVAAGLARSRAPGLALGGLGAAGAGWLIAASTRPIPLPETVREMSGGCVQRWIGPPQPDAFGLPEVERAARLIPGPITVIGAPEIPCEVQTTPPWIEHLRPRLEWAGLDREVREAPPEEPVVDGLIVDWRGGQGRMIAVPALGSAFALRGASDSRRPW